MKATMNIRKLESIVHREAKTFSVYVLEDRAIPSAIDGLKPVQRFFLYSALQTAKSSFIKVAAIGGRLSEFGYTHGEVSASDAGQKMANNWGNNLPILEGQGNFGSRLVKDAASSRYTFCKIHPNFSKYFRDTNIAPKHADVDHIPPKFYLPTIPYVLVNGVSGIAVGFDTEILPHDPKDVERCVIEYIKTGDIKTKPTIMYPEYEGTIKEIDSEVWIFGVYKLIGKTKLIITEIPYEFDRESYVELLDKLCDDDTIVRYEDNCGKQNFEFEVTLRRDFDTSDENILKEFSLKKKLHQRINCIDANGKIKVFLDEIELIKYFVDIRLPYVSERIKNKLSECKNVMKIHSAKVEFIQKVISGEIVISGKTKSAALKEISSHPDLSEFAEKLISMNMYHMTTDEVKKLKQEQSKLKKEKQYWETTDTKTEYLKDLEAE